MNKKNKSKRIKSMQVKAAVNEQQEKSNSLIFGGIIIALTSIGLLIFVLSEKVFYLG